MLSESPLRWASWGAHHCTRNTDFLQENEGIYLSSFLTVVIHAPCLFIYVFFINLNLLLVISMACANNDGNESRESCQNNLALSRVQEHQIKGAFLLHRFCVPWVQFWFINYCFGPNSTGDWFEEFIQHGEGSFEGLECGEWSELMTNNE